MIKYVELGIFLAKFWHLEHSSSFKIDRARATTLVAGNKDPHPKMNEGLLSNFGNFQPYIRP